MPSNVSSCLLWNFAKPRPVCAASSRAAPDRCGVCLTGRERGRSASLSAASVQVAPISFPRDAAAAPICYAQVRAAFRGRQGGTWGQYHEDRRTERAGRLAKRREPARQAAQRHHGIVSRWCHTCAAARLDSHTGPEGTSKPSRWRSRRIRVRARATSATRRSRRQVRPNRRAQQLGRERCQPRRVGIATGLVTERLVRGWREVPRSAFHRPTHRGEPNWLPDRKSR